MCMMYILWLICGCAKQKSKNELWLITLELDKIWKIQIHYKKDYLIRTLSVKKKFQKIDSSAPNQGPKIIDFELSNKQNYVNLRGWNPNLRAMGLIWSALSDFTVEKNFRTTLLILGFSSKRHHCFWKLGQNGLDSRSLIPMKNLSSCVNCTIIFSVYFKDE